MKISRKEIIAAVENDEDIGFCRKCGEQHDYLEIDAAKDECQVCGEMEVYSAFNLMLMLC